MPDFDALGRDVAAAADSAFDTAPALAVKQLWAWAGFDQGENPNHLWTVSVEATEDGFAVTAIVKDENVYVPEVTPAPPASAAELARSGADEEADAADEDTVDQAEPAEESEPFPAEPTAATDAEVAVTLDAPAPE